MGSPGSTSALETSVMVADDERSVVQVLEALIAGEDDLRLVGTAADADSAIATAIAEHPDVALLDVRMPAGGGLRAAREITRRCPSTRIIALTAHEDQETVIAMMAAGAHAYVPKGESTERILGEIHRGQGERTARREPSPANVWGMPSSPGRRRLEQRVRVQEVIESSAVRSAFQPIVELATGRLAGLEALARFPRMPIRSPDAWFAEAEAVGMLPRLEAMAIRVALAGLEDVPPDAFLSLNVSPTALGSPEVQEVLAFAPAHRLVLEITEHSAVEDYVELNRVLGPMRHRGFRIAIDDVGSGISSLRHVVMLAPDMLKIDMTLTSGIHRDPTRHAVVAALASCAGQIDAVSVAEGVGSIEEVDHLLEVGVMLGQGYALGEPAIRD